MIQFGGSDYSMSMGLTGQRAHPDIKNAERKTIETSLKMGLHPRVELADIKDAAPYLEMGVKHYCIGWDVRILYSWWKANGEGMHAMLAEANKGDKRKTAALASRAGVAAGTY
jgi:4-hydroxy-2-oxoheptanedioate aldolase